VLAFEHSFMASLVILMLGGPWLRRTACIPFEMFSFTASFFRALLTLEVPQLRYTSL